ncbi:MAG: hypothetical protein CL763_08865 [Chloroflexi bacterium]|nr:hypothetical protein [Chloroflexota bacterium]|tara:strand:- start:19274 stop:19519 length:246 start_codon:yes stop_codon:yes gene_type:complete
MQIVALKLRNVKLNIPYNKAKTKIVSNNFSNMGRFSTIKEIFKLYINRRKFHMFPIVIVLIVLIGVTALAQTGLVAFIYPI